MQATSNAFEQQRLPGTFGYSIGGEGSALAGSSPLHISSLIKESMKGLLSQAWSLGYQTLGVQYLEVHFEGRGSENLGRLKVTMAMRMRLINESRLVNYRCRARWRRKSWHLTDRSACDV